MIPIKGYATFDPLKHCLVGQTFSSDFFKHIIKEPKISGPLQRIADETEEDYLKLEKILKADSVFLTGTAAEIQPVKKILHKNFKIDHNLIKLLKDKYNSLKLDPPGKVSKMK